jgi:hypothetical protein
MKSAEFYYGSGTSFSDAFWLLNTPLTHFEMEMQRKLLEFFMQFDLSDYSMVVVYLEPIPKSLFSEGYQKMTHTNTAVI